MIKRKSTFKRLLSSKLPYPNIRLSEDWNENKNNANTHFDSSEYFGQPLYVL